MTTSARASRTARSTAGASNALTRATAAPRSVRARAPAWERVMPFTVCPRRTSSAMSGRPIAPLAPATKTFMVILPRRWGGLLLGVRDGPFLGVAGGPGHLYLAVPRVVGQGHPADRESTEDNRQLAASHDSSS